MKLWFLPVLLLLAHYTFAQNKQEQGADLDGEGAPASSPLILNVYGLHMLFLKQPAFGAGLSMGGNYATDLGLGLNFNVARRKIERNFGYEVGEALLTYYDISLYHDYRVQTWGRLSVVFSAYAGFASFRLSDNSIKERYIWIDEYGNEFESERPLPIETNYYMRIAPAAKVQYQLSGNIDLEVSGAYNFYAGGSRYGRAYEFNGYMLQAGLRFLLQ